ncbi:MAG: ribosomal protein S12 methylthiotransferase RimO [Gracilibacter sp. BRH_c7a]|nr:MAG: ribosomal protein S12 methylthiotransferase RimO [Gracilibacter sp. BRH_c7a]
MKKKAAVINLGCPKNQVDSEVISGLLAERYELTSNPQEANIVLVNTCGFINDAKEESIEVLCDIVELKSEGVCEKVYALGCLAQRYGKELVKEIPELDGVLGDGELHNIVSIIESDDNQRVFTWKETQDFLYTHEMPRIRTGFTFSTYVKIAEGCDNRCSYCAIPGIKGSYRSRNKESVLEETKRLAGEGTKEIILVAQDLTRYGLDLYGKQELPSLLKEMVRIDGLEWIRLMYCYPDVLTDELIDIIALEPKICNYLDIPLQHGDNEILARMNRRNTREQAEQLIEKLRSRIPEIFIRSTFITGFPGETERHFQNLQSFIKRMRFDRLGVFAYSQEENTPAGKMKDQVPSAVREARKDSLMAMQAELVNEIQQKRIGRSLKMILEEELPDGWRGRSEGDAPEIDGQVYCKTFQGHSSGDIINVKILQADSYDLWGEELE